MDPELADADFAAYQQVKGAIPASAQRTGGELPHAANEPFPDSHTTRLRPLHEQVLSQLRQVKDPDIGRDIVALGFIQDEAKSLVKCLPWVKEVVVGLDSMAHSRGASSGRPPNLRRVGFIVGIASCKGGSGKSTVALSLALMLRKSGAKVGLLDADIYGPSLPTLLNKEEARVVFGAEEESEFEEETKRSNEKTPSTVFRGRRGASAVRRGRIEYEEGPPTAPAGTAEEVTKADAGNREGLSMRLIPIKVAGIKCMSYGFIAKKNDQGYSALRGPFVSSVVDQLLTGTQWGSLDYLVVDLPPGTGDIHITLTQQQVSLDGCVVVTTAQALSLVDAEKGIRMLKSLCIPTLSVVCNMAYFVCSHCDERHELFGRPEATQGLAELSSAHQLVLLPFDVRLNSTTFAGSPRPDARDSFVDRLGPEDPLSSLGRSASWSRGPIAIFSKKVWSALRSLADRVACELSTLRYGSLKPQMSVTANGSAVLVALVRPEGALLGEGVPIMVKEAFEVSGDVLRSRCSCLECKEQQKGMLSSKDSDEQVHIADALETGDGTLIINWKDEHVSQFAVSDLLDLCRQLRLAVDEEGGKCLADPQLEW